MVNHPLALIPFASGSQVGELQTTLVSMGQQPIIVEPGAWLHASAPHHLLCPRLLYLGNRDYPFADISAALQIQRVAIIAIFDRAAEFSQALASLCQDFVCWPCAEPELLLRIERLRAPPAPSIESGDDAALVEEFANLQLIGQSPAFLATLRLIKRIAACDATVLIEGETGTGKELVARAIHYLSPRRDYPFLPVNCGAIPENLVENELFGHERGAYTDARDAQPGLVAQAQGGTLFLDEVETLPAKAQTALLRFLQDGQFRPLGGKAISRANVRIIAACNCRLDDLVGTRQFRQDLLYRLKIMTVTLPPLRDRAGDVELLAEHFLEQFAREHNLGPITLDPHTRAWIRSHSWPGNVRELENLLLREALLAESPTLSFSGQPSPTDRRAGTNERRCNKWLGRSMRMAKTKLVADFERDFLRQLLEEAGGNVTEAARRAGKERRAFGKLLQKYDLR